MRTPRAGSTGSAGSAGSARRLCCALTAALVLAVTLPAAAAARSPAPPRQVREEYVSMAGTDAPGPAVHDRVRVLKVGSARARQVLVLVPGQFAPPLLARALAGPAPSVGQWYWPNRLTLDLQVADPFADTPVARSLGLRLRHTRGIDVPLYSFQTGLTHGTANTAARWVVAQSRIPSATYAENEAMTHLDPLFAAPGKNTFLDSVTPFLARLGERRAVTG
ncbi:hypothetical protein ACGFZK_16620 [Streptomyces sp. NPDC048257]|uniref:hypothetical protein n=1 Tax=Streptomyces sp. NPDC048257 TaxID=3365526 RepID=UPI00371DCF9F